MSVLTPLHDSHVPGFTIQAGVLVQTEVVPEDCIADNQYISINVETDGSNQTYPGAHQFKVFLIFVHEGHELRYGAIDDDIYLTVSADDQVDQLEIIETLEDEEYCGVTLRIWTQNQRPAPFFELILVPLHLPVLN